MIPELLKPVTSELIPLIRWFTQSYHLGLAFLPTDQDLSVLSCNAKEYYNQYVVGNLKEMNQAIFLFLGGNTNWDLKLLPHNKDSVYRILDKIFNEFPNLMDNDSSNFTKFRHWQYRQ